MTGGAIRPSLILSLTLAAALGGCRSCRNDHPYVPAEPDAGPVAVAVDAGIRVAPADAGAEPAFAPPPGTTTWSGDGLSIDGGGQEIALVLARDFDGDGKTDALAVLRPSADARKPGSPTGQLVFVHGGENRPPGAIATGPALGTWPACVATARLERIGPRSAFAEIGSSCPKAVSERVIDVVRLGGPAPVVAFDATVTDPKDAPALTVDVQVADRDKDGIDDTILNLTLAGENGAPPLATKLAFFDRPAGPSRDPEEPDASLKAIAARIASTKTKTKDMPALVEEMRMLYRAICEEGGAPRITGIHGGPSTSCGSSKALEDAGIAEVRALAAEGEVLAAFAAADVAQAPPATRTNGRRFEIDKYLAAAAPVLEAKSVKVLQTAVDVPLDAQPQWGPLAFESTGKLLVRKGKVVTRVDPDGGDDVTADVAAWPSEVVSPDGKRRWIEAYQACEGTAYRANFAMDNDQMSEVPLPFAPRLGRGCTGHGDPVLAAPISWGARGLEAIVAGRAVLIKDDDAALEPSFLDEPAPLGSPRVHGSAAFTYALPSALVLRANGQWQQVKSSELRAADLRACAIDEAGAHVACVRGGKVVLIGLR